MKSSKRTVLITGCSDGGMGAALAKELHKAGLHVYATARDVSKMADLRTSGIETLELDITSDGSISSCVSQVPQLDILLNNAGAVWTMPMTDVSLSEAKKLFDLNVWGQLAVTRAFLPHLLRSKSALIVNHTSIGGGGALPWQGPYNASKAAMSIFSDCLRLELRAFDIKVVDLKTASVKTNILGTAQARQPELPEKSIYAPVRDLLEKGLRLEWVDGKGITSEQWAKEVTPALLKQNPPLVIRSGENATLARLFALLPLGSMDWIMARMTGFDKVEDAIRKTR